MASLAAQGIAYIAGIERNKNGLHRVFIEGLEVCWIGLVWRAQFGEMTR